MKKNIADLFLIAILVVAFVFRVIIFPFKTHWSDMYFWIEWGKGINQYGPEDFYNKFNSDYLPFYPLVLGAVYKFYYAIKNYTNFPIIYFYKLPAAISDILLGLLTYNILKNKSLNFALIAAILFLFNPAIFVNSSMWGQVDVIGTLFVVFCIYSVTKNRPFITGVSLGIALSIKPLYLIGLPVFMIALSFRNYNKFGLLIKNILLYIIGVLLSCFVITFPFSNIFDNRINPNLFNPFLYIINLYKIISSRYPYTTVNAFNFWALADKDFWMPDSRLFLGINFYMWGLLINLILSIGILFRLLITNKKEIIYKTNLSLALLFLSSYTFLTRMHERHMFYFLPFILIASFYKRIYLWIYFLMSFIYVINLNFALEYLNQDKVYVYSPPFIKFLSLLVVVNFLILAVFYIYENKHIYKS